MERGPDLGNYLDSRYSFDEDYFQRLKRGDSATEHHFAQYFDALIRIKAIRAGAESARAAEDIRQETLMRVLANVREGKVEHPERLGAYVLAISNNIIREWFRGSRRWTQLPEEASKVPSGESSAEQGLLDQERKDLMRRALGGLSSQDQELLRRICLENQDKNRICQEFGVTREYLRVLLHRARGRLREAVEAAKSGGRAADF